ncbi:unnamed protein product [Dovyalis caffra]|uniref:Zinc knuckle CX2CX4HX4C domain-containing protein n=1 Tax=Dovyalis caffra TaxID=77055 RepID=A0AAV1QQT8_9ROSI|nr:unnamed protein product [Dovyalis caffra]
MGMVNFKYERLPTFYFICGRIRHEDKFYEILFSDPQSDIGKPYGLWLRAHDGRQKMNVGEEWLGQGPSEMTKDVVADEQMVVDDNKPIKMAGQPTVGSSLSGPSPQKKHVLVFFSETLCTGSKINLFRRKLGFEGALLVECIGRGDGLALLVERKRWS